MVDYGSLTKTVDHFTKTGYPVEFQAESSGLYAPGLDVRLEPDEFDIADVCHFDGTAPGDEGHVLYLITSLPGLKGTLVLAAADVHSESMSFDMARKLRTHPYGEWICS